MTHTHATQTVTTEFVEVELGESLLTDEEERFLLQLQRTAEPEQPITS